MRRFELVNERSAKFWMAGVEGNCLIVIFGPLGTEGQRKERYFRTEAEAHRALARKISEKINKGYREVFTEYAPSDFFSAASPVEVFPLPPYLSDLFCPSPSCKDFGPGSLYLVGGTERNPALRCHRCGRKEVWRAILRENHNQAGTREALVFLFLLLSGIYFLPIRATWRLALAVIPVALIVEIIYESVRYWWRAKEIERKLAAESVLQ